MKFTYEQFVEFTDPLEGSVDCMYLDRLGKVTTARGYLIDTPADAQTCQWRNPAGDMLFPGNVLGEWNRCKNSGLAGTGGGNQRKVAKLFLADGEIDRLTKFRLAANEARLSKLLSRWDDLRGEAQLVAHSMSWAMGEGELERDWPHFLAALNAGDYGAAMHESRMKPWTGDDSLSRRNNANLNLLFDALTGADSGKSDFWMFDPGDLARLSEGVTEGMLKWVAPLVWR